MCLKIPQYMCCPSLGSQTRLCLVRWHTSSHSHHPKQPEDFKNRFPFFFQDNELIIVPTT